MKENVKQKAVSTIEKKVKKQSKYAASTVQKVSKLK